ncbi:HlyD family efflux transporter periplasmic adaptor subunit [Haliea sp. E1-2-M8]|uniref:HlyD family secretion protein n=1 Tax=Haliea sp. E1-2-M8 TaxID=3064706 RepID=UPI00271B48D7|nr:HlyD family efflux transporter periplasmic adaptor subunit [Haliea sp. E1-2-M8]MDO8861543.1 HlyD family efflux transporter periplasmic adaptor subunit [Haliea sp. E1-2-M8]
MTKPSALISTLISMSNIYRLTFTRKREIFQGKEPAVLLTAAHGGTYSFTADEYDLMVLFDGKRTFDQILSDFYKRKNVSFERDKLELFSERLLEEGLLAREGEDRLADDPAEADPDEEVINETVREVAGAGRAARPVVRDNTVRGLRPDVRPAPPPPNRDDQPAHARPIEELRQELERKRPKIRIPLWSQPLSPLGYLISLPARNTYLLLALLFAFAGALYGVLSNWDTFYRDVVRLLGHTNLIQAMLISLVVVNLSTQLSKASIFKSETGVDAPFGIAFFAWILPRFYADTVDSQFIRNRHKRMRLRGSDLTTLLFILVLSVAGWIASRSNGTFLPLIFAWTTVVSAITFLIQLNPLVKGAGYDILAAALRTGDLRERALTSAFSLREQPRGWGNRGEKPYPWAVRVYGICIVAFLLFVCYLLFALLGPWLEQRMGGAGVLILLTIVTLGLVSPVWSAWQRVKRIDKASKALSSPQSRYSAKKSPFYPKLRTLLILGGLILIGLLPWPYEPGGEFVILPAERVDVRALIPGEVRQILIKEGDLVEPGQVIAKLSDDEARSAVSVGEAKLRELNAQLRLLLDGAPMEEREVARQRVKTATTRLQYSDKKAARYSTLVETGQVSLSLYETAISDAAVDQEKLEEAQLNLARLEAAARPDEIAVLESKIEQQETELAYYRVQLAYTTLKSPIQGRIVSGSLEFSVGDYLREGDLLVVVEKTSSVKAEISVPEVDIAEVRLGERVRLKSWAYPHQMFYGEVTRIAPAADVKEYGKVVRVITTLENEAGLLKSEMTGHAKIRDETVPLALAFTRMLQRFVVIEIWSWLP